MDADSLPDAPSISSALPKKRSAVTIASIFFTLVVITLLILWLIYSNRTVTPLRQSAPKPSINFEQIEYTNSKTKDRVIGLVKKAQEENEASKSYNYYQQIFIELSLVYTFSHDPKVRHALTDLRNFLSQNYTKYFNQKNLKIPCFDAECGKADLSKEASEIRNEIKKNTTIDSYVKKSILREFEAASFASDKNSQWEHFLAVFNSISSEDRRTKKEDVREIAIKMKNFLKSAYPENYKTLEKLLPNTFEL